MGDIPYRFPNNADAYKGYFVGVRDGLKRFSWWRDGVQYVGTCGTTLHKALEETNERERTVLQNLLHEQDLHVQIQEDKP